MGTPLKESKIKKLEESLAASLTRSFLAEYWKILSMNNPSIEKVPGVYTWIEKNAKSSVKDLEIAELFKCLRLADRNFLNHGCLPKKINHLSEKTTKLLDKRYRKLTRNTSKKVKAGPLEVEFSETGS
jgi:hypothetical protein